MNIDIAGKAVVVTGAAQGIGRALALGLAAEGVSVGVLARDRKRAQLVVDEIGELPAAPPGLALEADVSDERAVIEAAAETEAAWGRLDGLINNAGWMPGSYPVLDLDVGVLDRVLRSNLVGSILATKHFAPLMIRSGGGRIIYLSSIAAVQAWPGGAAYARGQGRDQPAGQRGASGTRRSGHPDRGHRPRADLQPGHAGYRRRGSSRPGGGQLPGRADRRARGHRGAGQFPV